MRNILILTLLTTVAIFMSIGCSGSNSSTNSDVNIATSNQDTVVTYGDYGLFFDDSNNLGDDITIQNQLQEDTTIGGILIDPQDKGNDDPFDPDDPKNGDGGN